MATVKYMDVSYPCSKAIKGPDYIHLVDENGVMIAAFDGVSDFSGFSISNGSWATPTDTAKCTVVVAREDGTTSACGVPLEKFHRADTATILTQGVHFDVELPTSGIEGQLFFLIV